MTDQCTVEDTATLLDIEAIKQLKSRYCRFLDTKDWQAWRGLLADDFTSEIAGAGGRQAVGADEFVAYTRSTIGKPTQHTVHQVHAPEISLTSTTTARGVWALNDVVRLTAAVTLRGYGHSHETYAKHDGNWRITSSRLTRLREDIAIPLVPAAFAPHVRAAAARLARRTARGPHTPPMGRRG
jgi:hypothetical protein